MVFIEILRIIGIKITGCISHAFLFFLDLVKIVGMMEMSRFAIHISDIHFCKMSILVKAQIIIGKITINFQVFNHLDLETRCDINSSG